MISNKKTTLDGLPEMRKGHKDLSGMIVVS